MVWGDNNVVRRDYAVRRYANNKRKQSLVAEFFPDVNQITSLAHTHTVPSLFPIPSSGSGIHRWGRGSAYARGQTRQFIRLESRSIRRRDFAETWTLERVHTHVHALFDASCARTRCVHTHDFPAKMCSGLESIEDRFGRTHSAVAEMPAGTLPEKREKRWGENVCAPRIRAYLPLGMKRRAHIGKGAIVARRLRIRGGENNGRRSDAKRRSNKIYRQFLPRSSFSFNIPCARGWIRDRGERGRE